MILLAEDKNTHLEHLEDDIINNGYEGGQNAIAFLESLNEMLAGHSKSKVNVTTKWDGAPAIVCGPSPENGKFFVGTKSVFNKTPKVNYSIADIRKNHTGDLQNILRECLTYLSGLGMKEILQGDLMFTQSGKKKTTYKDPSGKQEQMISFQPNTIVYAVPVDSELGRQIEQAKFGIVFHTTYDSLDSGASFGADISGLRRAPGVWFDDAFFTDDTGVVTLTDDEEGEILFESSYLPKRKEIEKKIINYIGFISQIPPKVSAVKINGKRAYKLFRENKKFTIQPKKVFINPNFMNSLPLREISSGMGELIKYGLIWDKDFLNDVLKYGENNSQKNISYFIYKSCQIKSQIVEKDEKYKS